MSLALTNQSNLSTYETVISLYENYSFTMFPLKYKDKTPLKKWKWRYKSNLSNQYEYYHKWFNNPKQLFNYAIITGKDNLYVLDFDDIRIGNQFLKDNPIFNNTLIVKTSRGIHIYVKIPGKLYKTFNALYNNKRLGELKGIGGYVVGPGSLHSSGIYYSIINQPEHILVINDLADFNIFPESKTYDDVIIKNEDELYNKIKEIKETNLFKDPIKEKYDAITAPTFIKPYNKIANLSILPKYGNGSRNDWILKHGFTILNYFYKLYNGNYDLIRPLMIQTIFSYNDGTSKDYKSINSLILKRDVDQLISKHNFIHQSKSSDIPLNGFILNHIDKVLSNDSMVNQLRILANDMVQRGFVKTYKHKDKAAKQISDLVILLSHFFGKIQYDFDVCDAREDIKDRKIVRIVNKNKALTNKTRELYSIGHSFHLYYLINNSKIKERYNLTISVKHNIYNIEKYLFHVGLFDKSLSECSLANYSISKRNILKEYYYDNNIYVNVYDILINITNNLINNNTNINLNNTYTSLNTIDYYAGQKIDKKDKKPIICRTNNKEDKKPIICRTNNKEDKNNNNMSAENIKNKFFSLALTQEELKKCNDILVKFGKRQPEPVVEPIINLDEVCNEL